MKRLALLLVLAFAATAAADPSSDDRAKAASHFKQAQVYYASGDYDHAISEYEAAYALSSEPLLLFNIALCNDKANRPEKALAGFQHYLDLAPDGEVADEAREDVARLTPVVEKIKADRAAQDAEKAEAARKAEDARKAEEAKKADEARRAEAARQEHARRESEASRVERLSKLERFGGIGAAALGGLSIGLGIHYGLVARDDGRAISSHTMDAWTDALLAKDAEGRSANTKMIVFTTTGSVLVLGGAALYTLGYLSGREAERLRVDIAPTSGGAAVSLSGRF